MERKDDCKHNKAIECLNRSRCNYCGWKEKGPEATRRRKYIEKHRTNVGMMKKENAEIIQKSYPI